MLSLPGTRPLKVLFLGAHSDDIEIGCGGTVLELLRARPDVELRWVVFSADGVRGEEAMGAARRFIGARAEKAVELYKFRDTLFPVEFEAIKAVFHDIGTRFEPDVVFTHRREDRHQDHRTLGELAWNAFRRSMILEYEVPKWDGDLSAPNFFVPLSAESSDQKIRFLMEAFATQRGKDWFDEQTFRGLARLRGVECRAPSGYAEGFYARKLSMTW